MSEGPSSGAGDRRFVLLGFLFTVLRCQPGGKGKVSQVRRRIGSQLPTPAVSGLALLLGN